MNSRYFCGLLALGLWTLPSQGFAQAAGAATAADRTLSEQDAVAAAIVNNPTLHIALLRANQSRLTVRAEEALYTPIFDASAGYTHTRSPSLFGDDAVRVTTGDVFDVSTGITKPFSTGTVLSAFVSGQRSTRTSSTVEQAFGVTSGPGYSLLGQLAVSQPLLRGYGSDLGGSSLRQAKLSSAASELAARETASALLSQVVNAYWELWYAGEVIRINESSRDLARVQQEQADQQVQSGALAPASALPYATQLAELEEAVLNARTDERQRELALGQLLGQTRQVGDAFAVADAPRLPTEDFPVEARAVDDALASSYAQKQLKAQVAISKEQQKFAGDSLRPRLDVDAYVQAQGLGNRRVPPAFEQFGRMDAVSAHVGLTFETPLSDTRREAQIESARLSAHMAEKQLVENELAIRSSVASSLSRLRAARDRLDLSTRTEKVARDQAEAERARFQAGSSIAISVQQAENSLRLSQLRVQRARVDLMLSELTLAELRGQLLTRYSGALARLPVADRGTLERPAPSNF